MSLTMDERKERYYKLVLEKANKIYSLWRTKGIASKRLVAQANEYAFDHRLKTNANYRFHVFAFAVALGMRLEKRYGTFFRRLFHLFAYFRERAALKMLKRVFGFHGDTDIREMMDWEAENIIVLLSHQQNQGSTGGGKRSEMGDIAVEEALNSFFKECIQEEEQKTAENKLDTAKGKNLDAKGKPILAKTEDVQREKISVEELGKGEQVGEQKKKENSPTKIEQTEKQKTEPLETGSTENKKVEKPVGKTVASTSILAETIILAQEKEEDVPSPFPIFRETTEGKATAVGKEDSSSSKEKTETKIERENGENFDKDIRGETDREKSPFPVFHGEKVEEIKPPEKVAEKEIKEIKGSEEKTGRVQAKISEENKVRIELNTTMSKEQIWAIAARVIAMAQTEMKMEEQAWREKISISNSSNEIKTNSKKSEPSPNKSNIVTGLKK